MVWNKGIPCSEETKEKIRKKLKGNKHWVGRKHSKESKIKIGLASSKRKHTEETKRRISESQKGRIPWWILQGKECPSKSKVSRLKLSIAGKGIKKPKGFGEKISKALSGKRKPYLQGSKHYNWKGGITPLNNKIRNSIEYNAWRKKVYRRDNFTCQECGDNESGTLIAHHLKSFASFPEERLNVDNGITMCEDCHEHLEQKLKIIGEF